MENGNDPFGPAEAEMVAAGHSLDKIPQEIHEQHLWADALLLFWSKHHRLPTEYELSADMLTEWDDPVPVKEAYTILWLLK
jgi:hypothetical protein